MHTKALAEYAVGLTFEDLPADVRNLARDRVQDTIGIGIFGAQMPWSRIITDYVTRSAGAGPARAASSAVRCSTRCSNSPCARAVRRLSSASSDTMVSKV